MNLSILCVYLHYNPSVNENEFLDIEICKQMLDVQYGDKINMELNCWEQNKPWSLNKDSDIYLLLVDHFNIEQTIKLAKAIKTKKIGAYIILTGDIHDDFGVQLLNHYKEIDCIIYDKIAPVYHKVLDALIQKSDISKLPGIILSSGAIVIKNPADTNKYDMDILPYAGRTFFEINKNNYMKIFSHKGCAGNCHFCYLSKGNYKNTLARNGKKVVEEIAYMQNKYGIHKFDLLDLSVLDFGSEGIKRLNDMIDEIKYRKIHICISYQIRADQINEETRRILQKAKGVGINYAFVGIESICEDELRMYNKRACVEDNRKAIQILKEEKIGFTIGFLPFHAKTNYYNLHKNLDFLYEIGYTRVLEKFINPIMVYPGTMLFTQYQDEGILKNYQFPQGYSYIKYHDLSIERMLNCLMDMPAYKENLEDLDIAVTWLLTELDTKVGHLSKGILDLCHYIAALQQKQNEINYAFLKSCLHLGESGEYDKLKNLCNKFNLHDYKQELQSSFTKLSIKCKRLKLIN